jgi:hypothetical protein
MATDVIIDPSTGQIYWNDSAGVGTESISIKGDAVNTISFTGYSGSFSPGSTPAGALTLVTIKDSAGTDALIPGTSGYNLGSSTLRWNTFATNANLSGTLVVSDSTISSSLLTGSVRFNGGIAISGNASIGQSLNFYNTSNANYVGFKAGVTAANTLYTLPLNFPGSGTSVLQSDTSGTLTWVPLAASSGSGLATTATNVYVNILGNPNASHPLLMTPAQLSAGSAISANGTLVYNPLTDILTTPGLAVTSGVDSANTTSGALQVRGGIGVTGTGYFDVVRTRALVTTGDGTVGGNFTFNGLGVFGNATSDTINSLARYISDILPSADNSYDLGNNSLGWRNFRVSGVGTVVTLAVTSPTASTSTTTGALVVTGGVGIGGSIFTAPASRSSISGVTFENNRATNGFTINTTSSFSFNIQDGANNQRLNYHGDSNRTEFTGNNAVHEIRLIHSNNSAYTGLKSNSSGTVTYTFPAGDGSNGQLLFTNGSGGLGWTTVAGGGVSGIISVNGLTAATQTFATGTSGTDFAISSVTSTHTFNLPDASATARGLVTTGSQTLAGAKTFTSALSVTASTAAINTSTGALIVTGGVGIGGSLYTATGSSSSISGVFLANNTVSASTYNKVAITAPATLATLTLSNNSSLITSGGHSLTFTTTNTTNVTVPTTGTLATTSNKLSDFAATTSLELKNTISDETGSGALVFATSPDFTTSVTTGSATFSLFNATATNISAFGAATTLSIGAASGKATINSVDNSTSSTTGAFVVTGGAAIGQSLSIAGRLQMFNGATNYTAFLSSASTPVTYTLPPTAPAGVGSSYLSASTTGVMAWVAAPTSGGSATPGGSNKQIQYNNASTFGGAAGFEYITAGIANTVSIFSASGTGYTAGMWIHSINGSTTRVGIGLSNPQFELEINGELSATNKSFVIDHPTKSGMKLRYGSLEGPENGVYVRGELNNSNIIEVPDHWIGLVHEDSYTVHLTPIGSYAQLYVEKIENYNVFVADNMMCPIHCYYSVWAERKDIPKLVTEY